MFALLLVVPLAFAFKLVLFPRHDEVVHADAIVVLGPVPEWRQQMAAELVDQGVADTVAFTSGEKDLSDDYCAPIRPGIETICYAPEPYTTQGEAAWVKEQAETRGWERVIVITMNPHIERARFIFERCVDGSLDVRVTGRNNPDQDLEFVLYQFAYQSGAFFKAAFVTPGC